MDIKFSNPVIGHINEDFKNENQTIQRINGDTVHRICSGQVVLSLSIAMKELVENSVDSGATIIDIRLKEYGSELLEVSDNGSGVPKENFQALTLKHYTSKIREFSDLEHVGTLGFRGEALSSLCALSNLVVVTKHKTANLATKLCYDRNGKVLSETPTAREQGTTVILEDLFSTLPVRRKEFLKNMKREFSKMCQLLYAYCLVSKGIKFTCTNVTSKGSKSTIVATEGHTTIRENIITIFGAKQLSTLIDVERITPDEAVQSDYGIKLVPGDEIPFNLEFLISSVVHGSGRSSADRQFYFINSRPCEPSKLMKLVNEIYKQFNGKQYPFVYLNITTKTSLVDVNVTPDKRQVFIEKEKLLLATVKASLLEAFKAFPSTFKMQNIDISRSLCDIQPEKGKKRGVSESSLKRGSILETFKKRSKLDQSVLDNHKFHSSSKGDKYKIERDIETEADEKLNTLIEIACKLSREDSDSESIVSIDTVKKESNDNFNIEDLEISLDAPVKKDMPKKFIDLKVDLEHIRKQLEKENLEKKNLEDIKVKFRSEIKPEANKNAEEELQKQISKVDFTNMEVIGQFNLGFIIAKLNDDLFIVDQHATDEKYNFEQLQQNTTIDSQILVNPKQLELTAASESILIENEEVFKKNGFKFKIDETAPCTKKVLLTAIPVSKTFAFGKGDIDEMIFMLQDASHSMCRPSRVRAMFASRACRKSVMIGKHLSKSDMRRLVDHMGEIDQPWNCPHGRPTMRHLINLNLIEHK